MSDDTKKLGFYSVVSGNEIHIIDTDPFSLSRGGGLTDVSLIEKYRMDDEVYEKRANTMREVKPTIYISVELIKPQIWNKTQPLSYCNYLYPSPTTVYLLNHTHSTPIIYINTYKTPTIYVKTINPIHTY
jgi:hypothetical protein